MDGHLALSFDLGVMRIQAQEPPWKVVRAFHGEEGQSLVHLNNLSGGVLGGDQLTLSIEVASSAHVQVTSTGATRIYKAREGRPASSASAKFQVGEGGLLEYLPDPLIPFANSDFEQHTSFQLAHKATLFWWETIAPGREAMGEMFAYRRLAINAEVCDSSGPIVIERLKLTGQQQSIARMGPFRYLSTFYICQPGVLDWTGMERRLTEISMQLSATDGVRWGVSALNRNGIVVRGLNVRSSGIADHLLQFWRAAKLLLCGRPAVPPRKTY